MQCSLTWVRYWGQKNLSTVAIHVLVNWYFGMLTRQCKKDSLLVVVACDVLSLSSQKTRYSCQMSGHGDHMQ